MSKRAVHMYEWDGGTESDQDMPDEVLCGTDGEMTDEQLTNDWHYVTCKRCLRIRAKELAAQAIDERDQKAKLFDEAQAITIELGYRNVSTAIKALRKDAERYRWLRQRQLPLDGHDFLSTQETLDRRIDAAMAKEAKP
ncbi:hypothetical protein QEM14_001728 [Pseudomonas putida]|nr:hypothetical protein [Pseudomonas putida]